MLRPPALLRLRRGQLQKPGIPRINWSHPLAWGLVTCYMPGAYGKTIYDLTGQSPHLAWQTNAARGLYVEGVGLNSRAANGGAQATATANLKMTVGASLFWHGLVVSQDIVVNSCDLIGVDYDNANNAPYFGYGITTGVLSGTDIGLQWNSGGAAAFSSATLTPTNETLYSIGGTFAIGGNAVLYADGAVLNSTAFGASAPSYTASSMLSIGAWSSEPTYAFQGITGIACAWNRVLSAAEMLELHNDPYCFLIYPEDEIFAAVGISSGSKALSGADTFTNFVSSAALITGRKANAADTWGDFTSSGTFTQTIKLSGGNTVADFVSNSALVARRNIAATDAIADFISSGTFKQTATLNGVDTWTDFGSASAIVSGHHVTASSTWPDFVSTGVLVQTDVLTGADTWPNFVSAGTLTATAGRTESLSGANTIQNWIESAALVAKRSIAAADTWTDFTNGSSLVAGRKVSVANTITDFVSVGVLSQTISLHGTSTWIDWVGISELTLGHVVSAVDIGPGYVSNGTIVTFSSSAEALSGADTWADFVSVGFVTGPITSIALDATEVCTILCPGLQYTVLTPGDSYTVLVPALQYTALIPERITCRR